MRFVAVLVLATGCRQLLGFEELAEPSAGDAPIVEDGSGTDGASSDTPLADAALVCPASYTIVIDGSASRYRHVTSSSITWLNANTDCVNDGTTTHLIVLTDDIERAAIEALTDGPVRWIGLSNRAAIETYVPVTDEQVSYPPASGTPWAPGEPSFTETRCVALAAGALITLSCGNGRNFICECDAFADDPMNY